MEDINRIKLVLVEKKRTNKWLSEQMGGNTFHRFKVVYKLITTRFEQSIKNSRFA